MKSLARLLSAALLVSSTAWAQTAGAVAPPDSTATQSEMQTAQDLIVRATAEFEGTQQSRSIVILDDIITRLETLRHQGTLPPRGREMLVSAYEMRGRAYYNIGLQEKAAESFRSLVQTQPQYVMSRERISPKIVDYFNSVKKAMVGYLAVSSKPAGAKVSLNGEYLGLTDFFPLEVLAGDYNVEVAREGFRADSRTLSIAPRATETLTVELTRSSASSFFITEPAGVEVWVDGELRGTTAGSLAPESFALAESKGLDPAKASSRTEVGGLSLGSHTVELRKKCHEPVRRTIETPEAQDYEAEPVRLDESLASLQLTSDPPGGKIFLDGEPMGQTPRQLEGLCSGRHRLEVKHSAGKFVQDVVLAKNEDLTLDAPIRPSLAFLGVVAEGAGAERIRPQVEEVLRQNLSKISTLNFVPAPPDTVDRILESEHLTRRSLLPTSGTEPDVIRKATEKLASALEAQGFLLAVVPDEKLLRTAVLYLLAAGNTVPDKKEVNFNETPSYMGFIAAVDKKATVYRPWTGMITVDTELHEGVPVLRVVSGSPADQAGIVAGEILFAADGKPIQRTADFLALIASKRSKEKLSLHLRGAGGTRAVELTVGETPQEIPLHDPALPYNKVMMDLRQQVEGYPGTEAAAFARLNLALAAMHFDDFAAAHEHLIKARDELPVRPGLSQGTALYYLGLSLERLGYKKEAVEAYRAASGFKAATLFNNDGPAVALIASRRGGS